MSTPKPIAILDTNIAWYTPPDELARVAERFTLRIGEGALIERWVHCVREHKKDRARARSMFFGRAKKIAGLLDPVTPVEVGGGHLTRRVIAQADGLRPVPQTEERVEGLTDQWRHIVGVEHNDEEWVAFAEGEGAQHLDWIDSTLIDLGQPASVLAKKIPPELLEDNARFDALPDVEQRALLAQYIAQTLKLSPAAAERLDAHVRGLAFRLQAAATGDRMPKKNDGADFALTAHLGSGHFVLTNERALVDIVDGAGTYQAPWVRRLDDLDGLPDGPPWGESAREAARTFKRRK
jgi:hypothetical protein